MNASALVIMLITLISVTGITIYFFSLVLRTPPKPEPDSYLNNDDEVERQVHV
ncbi:hypothetical protein [Pontibacter ruber]|uniref:Cbb3-type cytochrome oxidase assembly protein CcoS n=1 Tax=Pontibacter ruber TaxID=1343895 RepID=A0ABW5CXW7_9BACT|nr:hypothetical protein [Pontibacter ruber]